MKQPDLFGTTPKQKTRKDPPYLCDRCGSEACYGRGVDSRKGKRGEWFCTNCLPPDYWASGSPLEGRARDMNTGST